MAATGRDSLGEDMNLSVREPRLDPLLEQLDDVEPAGEADDADGSRTRLGNVEQIVEQSLGASTNEGEIRISSL